MGIDGMKNKVAFFPDSNCEKSYIYMMRSIISERYEVLDYCSVKKSGIGLDEIRSFYLNWIESELSLEDREFISKSKKRGVKIIWVFHNRFPHDSYGNENLKDNMMFMCNSADVIVIHSHSSIRYLDEYNVQSNAKIEYLPHLNFIGAYGEYGRIEPRLEDGVFIFSSLGLIRPYKNLEILISAFNMLPDGFDVRLLIAGEAKSDSYLRKLKELKRTNNKIVILEGRISSLEMGTILNATDISVLPYDIKSGMNSGVMIMGFSYKKTAIVTEIAMAQEYENNLIYKYTYTDDADHVVQLGKVMQKAYLDGKDKVAEKGEALYELVKKNNSLETVRHGLFEII